MFIHDKVPQVKGPDYPLATYSPAKAPDYKICRRLLDTRKRVLQHLKSVHKITGDTAPCIIHVYVENDEFIPPGDAILSRIGTPEENTA